MFSKFCILLALYLGLETRAIADQTSSGGALISPFLSDAFTVIKLSQKKQAFSRFP